MNRKKKIIKKVIPELEKLVRGLLLPIKYYRLNQLQRELVGLILTNAPREEINEVKVLIRGYRNRIKFLLEKRKAGEVPSFGELVLMLVIPEENLDFVLGDLAEEYAAIEAKKGVRAAQIWFSKQVFNSVWDWALPVIRKVVWWTITVWVANHLI